MKVREWRGGDALFRERGSERRSRRRRESLGERRGKAEDAKSTLVAVTPFSQGSGQGDSLTHSSCAGSLPRPRSSPPPSPAPERELWSRRRESGCLSWDTAWRGAVRQVQQEVMRRELEAVLLEVTLARSTGVQGQKFLRVLQEINEAAGGGLPPPPPAPSPVGRSFHGNLSEKCMAARQTRKLTSTFESIIMGDARCTERGPPEQHLQVTEDTEAEWTRACKSSETRKNVFSSPP